MSITSISCYLGMADDASSQDQDWLDQQASDFFTELEDDDIESTDEGKELGYMAIRWMVRRLGLIS